jgi:hypothetical protein
MIKRDFRPRQHQVSVPHAQGRSPSTLDREHWLAGRAALQQCGLTFSRIRANDAVRK